jgi:hypothetical protein
MDQQAPVAAAAHPGPASPIVASPTWLLAIRGAQFVLAVIILGLSASAIHDAYIDEEGLSLAIVSPFNFSLIPIPKPPNATTAATSRSQAPQLTCPPQSLFTWIIVLYSVLTEKLPALQQAYHIFAVLALDGFMMLMWLVTMAAVAAKRSKFIYDVSVGNCYDRGTLVNSKTCSTFSKREVVLFQKGMDIMSAIAGLSGLML